MDIGKEYKLIRWEGQLPLCGNDNEDLPPKIRLYGVEEDQKDIIGHRFVVSGFMYDFEFNMSFKFSKAFDTELNADNFFQKFKFRYPNSKMELRENKLSRLKKYF